MLLDFPVDLEANTPLAWVRVSAFLCLSPSFPHSFPDCFNSSHLSFTFPSIPSPFLGFFSSLNSLTASYYYSTYCVKLLLFTFSLSHKSEKGFAITVESRFCFVMIMFYYDPCFALCTDRKLFKKWNEGLWDQNEILFFNEILYHSGKSDSFFISFRSSLIDSS